MDLLVHGAELLWTGRRELTGADLLCRGGSVAAVGADAGGAVGRDGGRDSGEVPAGATRLDASGCVVIPGLVNAHHHLLQSAFRTLPGTRHVRMDRWLAAMAGYYRKARVDPELTYDAAAVGVAEGLLAGVTTVADHHLTWPAGVDPLELAAATIAAAGEVGGRLVFVRGTAGDDAETAALSVESLVGRFGAAAPHGSLRTAGGPPGSPSDASASLPASHGHLQIACGPAGVHSDGPETFAALGEVAARHGLARRTQANEQVDVERAAARWGRRPLELLDEWGWLAPDVTVAHLCDITAAERVRFAASGAHATHAPGCDVPMGWGVAEVGALADAGVTVGLGTSGGGSNDAGNLLADARLALQVGGLTSRPPTAREVLTMATAGSAAGLGRPELGRLEVGAAADLCCFDITGVADAGVADPLAGLLWANPGRRPRHVVVAGQVVVHNGELRTADAQALAAHLRSLLHQRLGT